MKTASSLLMIVLTLANHALAQSPESKAAQKKAALDIILAASETICVQVSQESDKSQIAVSGKISAELAGVAKKLADVGLSGAAKYKDTATRGVLQQDLADVIKSESECRLQVLKELKDVFLTDEPEKPQTALPVKLKVVVFEELPTPTRQSYSASSGRVAVGCGRTQELFAEFDAPSRADFEVQTMKVEVTERSNVASVFTQPPVTEGNHISASGVAVGLPPTGGCRSGYAVLTLSGTYLVRLASNRSETRTLNALIPYGPGMTWIQLPKMGIGSVVVEGSMPELPDTPVVLLTVSPDQQMAESANHKVSAYLNPTVYQLGLSAER